MMAMMMMMVMMMMMMMMMLNDKSLPGMGGCQHALE